jgi:hypothetical protein
MIMIIIIRSLVETRPEDLSTRFNCHVTPE